MNLYKGLVYLVEQMMQNIRNRKMRGHRREKYSLTEEVFEYTN